MSSTGEYILGLDKHERVYEDGKSEIKNNYNKNLKTKILESDGIHLRINLSETVMEY